MRAHEHAIVAENTHSKKQQQQQQQQQLSRLPISPQVQQPHLYSGTDVQLDLKVSDLNQIAFTKAFIHHRIKFPASNAQRLEVECGKDQVWVVPVFAQQFPKSKGESQDVARQRAVAFRTFKRRVPHSSSPKRGRDFSDGSLGARG